MPLEFQGSVIRADCEPQIRMAALMGSREAENIDSLCTHAVDCSQLFPPFPKDGFILIALISLQLEDAAQISKWRTALESCRVTRRVAGTL